MPSEPEQFRTEETTGQHGELRALLRKQFTDLSKTAETCVVTFGAQDDELTELKRKNEELQSQADECRQDVTRLRRVEEEKSRHILSLKHLLDEKEYLINSLEKQANNARTQQLLEKIPAFIRQADPKIKLRLDLLIQRAALQIAGDVLENSRKTQEIQLQTFESIKQQAEHELGMLLNPRTPFDPIPENIPKRSGIPGITARVEPNEGQGKRASTLDRESQIQPWTGKPFVISNVSRPPIEFTRAARWNVSPKAEKPAIQEINNLDGQSSNLEPQHNETTRISDKVHCELAAMKRQIADLESQLPDLRKRVIHTSDPKTESSFNNTSRRVTK